MHSIYTREREAALQARLWGAGDERFDDADLVDIAGNPVDQTRSSDAELSSRARILIQIKKAIGACYPWIHAGHEGVWSLFIFCGSLGVYQYLFSSDFGIQVVCWRPDLTISQQILCFPFLFLFPTMRKHVIDGMASITIEYTGHVSTQLEQLIIRFIVYFIEK